MREVMHDAQRERLVTNIAGLVAKVADARIRDRAVQYWRKVDACSATGSSIVPFLAASPS